MAFVLNIDGLTWDQRRALLNWKIDVLDIINERRELYQVPRWVPFWPFVLFYLLRFTLGIIRCLWRTLLHVFFAFLTFIWPFSRVTPSKYYRRRHTRTENIPPSAAAQVFAITELREHILRYADPLVQLTTAWNVSRTWRDTLLYILQSSKAFRKPYAPLVVAYAHRITLDPTFTWRDLKPPMIKKDWQKGMRDLQNHPTKRREMHNWALALQTPPSGMPKETFAVRDELQYFPHVVDWGSCTLSRYVVGGVGDMKLTQYLLNPYLSAVFGKRWSFQDYRCEISLREVPRTAEFHLLSPTFVGKEWGDAVCEIFVTQPPCQGILICAHRLSAVHHQGDAYSPGFKTVRLVKDKDGVRCKQLLSVLNMYSLKLLADWTKDVDELKSRIRGWVDWNAEGVWTTASTPKFALVPIQTLPKEALGESDGGVRPFDAGTSFYKEWLPESLMRKKSVKVWVNPEKREGGAARKLCEF